MSRRQLSLLRSRAVLQRGGWGRTFLYQKIKEGVFPPAVKIGGHFSAWPEHEIDAVLTARIAGASDDELRALVSGLLQQRQAAFAELTSTDSKEART